MKQLVVITAVTISATILGPILYFLAIMLAPVINVALFSTTQIEWALILGFLFTRERPSLLTIINTLLAAIGVAVIFYLYTPEYIPINVRLKMANVGTGWLGHILANFPKSGEICTTLGAFFIILGDQLTRKYIAKNMAPFLNIYRTFFGAIIFFTIAVKIFGFEHFNDLASPFLWKWMLLYSGLIVVAGTYSLTRALQLVDSNELAVSNTFLPIAGIVFAFLILGEIPNKA